MSEPTIPCPRCALHSPPAAYAMWSAPSSGEEKSGRPRVAKHRCLAAVRRRVRVSAGVAGPRLPPTLSAGGRRLRTPTARAIPISHPPPTYPHRSLPLPPSPGFESRRAGLDPSLRPPPTPPSLPSFSLALALSVSLPLRSTRADFDCKWEKKERCASVAARVAGHCGPARHYQHSRSLRRGGRARERGRRRPVCVLVRNQPREMVRAKSAAAAVRF
jgi:hypothetical protein